ncbi:Type I restriction enzyme EcoKI M protein [Stieleria neptunia]|uniref:site-specific DNA-methyltransferase (adenine-specific) n=1 Tax=Stieleria neptunia TaxID=2527979 RepID=A0A518HNT4_9BACT|nr:N-6 DNA methylase [Stieleria neptunia]QDV42502.1 Type I restriction enzyme EcoKI M protein [Stieleria neptunia]
MAHLTHGAPGRLLYDGLFTTAPATFDCVLSNPPFGGKEGKEAQTHFAFKTGATQVLFLQHVLDSLSAEGRCGIVVDEGVLFRTNESAFVDTKRKLLEECDLHCIVSLPGGVFTAAGAGVKTNLLFFNRGKPTEKIWYYDLSDIKVGKKKPFTIDRFDEFFKLLNKRKDSDRSWTVDFTKRKAIARTEAEPFHREALKKEQAANGWKADLKELKKAKPPKKKAIAEADAKIKELGKEARELRSKAEAIENAVFDLKAVNPNTRVEADTRTPAQLIKEIEKYGKEIEKALARLKS